MLSRAFNVIGLTFGVAGLKARLLAFAAKRSVAAVFGYIVAAIVALAGTVILLGAGYVALVPVVGVPIAMAIVGVFLLLVASVIWVVANQKIAGSDDDMTEDEVRRKAERDTEELRSLLGLSDDDDEPDLKHTGPHNQPSPDPDAAKGIKDPMVAIATGFAALSLFGPGRLFRTARLAAGIASVTAMAKRAIRDNGESKADNDPLHRSADPTAPLPTPQRRSSPANVSPTTPPSTDARDPGRHARESEHTQETALR